MNAYLLKFYGAVLLVCLFMAPHSTSAYQFIEFLNPDDEMVRLKWGEDNMPVPYYFNETPPEDFSLQEAVNAARASFDTWESIPTSTITFRYVDTTSAEPFVFFDFINTLGFSIEPDLEGTGILGATNWIVFTFTGEIAESDIVFNKEMSWSVDPDGVADHFDFQSIATHEIGHFIGLGHSAAGVMETDGGNRRLLGGSASMHPFAFPDGTITGRTPIADDIVGVSALYPTDSFTAETGSLSGTVTKNGIGLKGAHILAFNPFTDESVGFFAGQNGEFTLPGLRAGPYVIRVNPITDPTSPDHFDFDEGELDLNFQDTFREGRAEVQAREVTTGIDVEVQP